MTVQLDSKLIIMDLPKGRGGIEMKEFRVEYTEQENN